jgi:hypothetical protein
MTQNLTTLGGADAATAEAKPAPEYKTTNIVQSNGPAIKFKGRLVWQMSFTPKSNGVENTASLYETEAGAWVAVLDKAGLNDYRETVAEVIEADTDDLIADRIACMNLWGWSSYLRRAVREDMGWKLTRVVA